MAIVLEEAEDHRLRKALGESDHNLMSAGAWIELSAVCTRRSLDRWSTIKVICGEYKIGIAPVSLRQAEIGAEAYRRYGIGTKHRAQLNYGDCFAYALAIERDEPLLFKGDDFGRTDVKQASY